MAFSNPLYQGRLLCVVFCFLSLSRMIRQVHTRIVLHFPPLLSHLICFLLSADCLTRQWTSDRQRRDYQILCFSNHSIGFVDIFTAVIITTLKGYSLCPRTELLLNELEINQPEVLQILIQKLLALSLNFDFFFLAGILSAFFSYSKAIISPCQAKIENSASLGSQKEEARWTYLNI